MALSPSHGYEADYRAGALQRDRLIFLPFKKAYRTWGVLQHIPIR
jgi:hypothetical protein